MSERCPTCGEEGCGEKRAEFAREPWLPNGFEIGAQWQSYDGGLTWQRFPCATREAENAKRTGSMTVQAIDMKTGTVVIKVNA